MTPNYYKIISDCLETGCRRGVARAFKHDDDPTYDKIESDVYDAIMLELHERFYFTAPKEEIDYNEL